MRPADFVVEELWQPASGALNAGEHSLLLVEKEAQNTQWVARQIARSAGVRDMDVGFHGLKDRQAVAKQWFSIYSGKRKAPDWRAVSIPGVKILKIGKTPRKLRRGGHSGNRFRITLHDVNGCLQSIDEKFQWIRESGFPNYFGLQRFGHDGKNLELADVWFRDGRRPAGRALRSIVLSAARSYLFNRILHQRVVLANWTQAIAGDQLIPTEVTAASQRDTGRCVPSGAMFGGAEYLESTAGRIEKQAVSGYACWLQGLHREGVRTSRRALVAFADHFSWSFTGKAIRVQFDLAPGVYASVLLEQVFCLKNSREKQVEVTSVK